MSLGCWKYEDEFSTWKTVTQLLQVGDKTSNEAELLKNQAKGCMAKELNGLYHIFEVSLSFSFCESEEHH